MRDQNTRIKLKVIHFCDIKHSNRLRNPLSPSYSFHAHLCCDCYRRSSHWDGLFRIVFHMEPVEVTGGLAMSYPYVYFNCRMSHFPYVFRMSCVDFDWLVFVLLFVLLWWELGVVLYIIYIYIYLALSSLRISGYLSFPRLLYTAT